MATATKPAAAKPTAKKPVAKKTATVVETPVVDKVAVKSADTVKSAVKPAAKKETATSSEKATEASRPNAGFMKPMLPSAILSAVVGENPIPRTEVTKKVWEYIKAHKLQDEANKRMINADEKLEAVFGGKKQVSMFEMTKLISAHLK
jgi:upstream activation factor subunit UAF30